MRNGALAPFVFMNVALAVSLISLSVAALFVSIRRRIGIKFISTEIKGSIIRQTFVHHMSASNGGFDLSDNGVDALYSFLKIFPALSLSKSLETLRSSIPGLTLAKLRELYDAHFFEVSQIEVPGLDSSCARDNEMKLALRLITLEEPRFYLHFIAPFFNKERSPDVLIDLAPFCKILLDAMAKLFQHSALLYKGPCYSFLSLQDYPALSQAFAHCTDAFVVGQYLTLPTFIIVSLDGNYSQNTCSSGVIFVFVSVLGVRINLLSANLRNSEVLVPPQTTFVIRAVVKLKEAVVVTLEMRDSSSDGSPTARCLSSFSASEISYAVLSISPAFSVYSKNFTENGFDGSTLESLDVSELNEMLSAIGITNIAHKASIKANLLKWKGNPSVLTERLSRSILELPDLIASSRSLSVSDAFASAAESVKSDNGRTVSSDSAPPKGKSRQEVEESVARRRLEMSLPPASGEVRVLEKFITSEQCKHLIKHFAKKCDQSKVVNPQSAQSAEAQPKWRTSTSALMYQTDRDPVVLAITEKVAHLCKLPTSHVEVLQLVRYEKGQQYTPHRDYFEPNFKGQNRIFTILVYLNDLDSGDGGRTIFPNYKVEVVPKMGTAVFWRNCLDDGTLLPDSLHTGEVLNTDEKIKYAINCWIRNGPILY